MLTQHTVADAARAAGLPVPIRFLPVTGSTNDDVLDMAHAGAPEWTVMVAARQESGRGRLGRTWSSPPGTSLAVSVLLRPSMLAADAPLLGLMAAVCMAEACADACGVTVRSKWPNDLTVGDRKVGGILPEAQMDGPAVTYAVIGAGVNVGQGRDDFASEFRETATSLAAEGGKADATGLLAEFLVRMRRAYTPADSSFGTQVVGAYRRLCATLGRTVRATTTDGHTIEGEAVDIGPAGHLMIRTASGALESVGFGEVQLLR